MPSLKFKSRIVTSDQIKQQLNDFLILRHIVECMGNINDLELRDRAAGKILYKVHW